MTVSAEDVCAQLITVGVNSRQPLIREISFTVWLSHVGMMKLFMIVSSLFTG